MGTLRRVNDMLQQRTGYRITRPAVRTLPAAPRPPGATADRLVPSPVFVISSVRSGSTLLRAMLDTHSRVHAPVELHLQRLVVTATSPPAEHAMTALGLNRADLEHLLWDRLLHRSLAASGKEVVVEKTPGNAFSVDRLATCWPGARFIHLLRHPLATARSWHESDPANRPMPLAVQHIARYARAVDRARESHPGLTVRYEDLTADPAGETARVCAFLDVPWEEGMLRWSGRDDQFVRGIGDWSDRIRSGRVQAARPLPDDAELPAPLRPIAERWGYAAR